MIGINSGEKLLPFQQKKLNTTYILLHAKSKFLGLKKSCYNLQFRKTLEIKQIGLSDCNHSKQHHYNSKN